MFSFTTAGSCSRSPKRMTCFPPKGFIFKDPWPVWRQISSTYSSNSPDIILTSSIMIACVDAIICQVWSWYDKLQFKSIPILKKRMNGLTSYQTAALPEVASTTAIKADSSIFTIKECNKNVFLSPQDHSQKPKRVHLISRKQSQTPFSVHLSF